MPQETITINVSPGGELKMLYDERMPLTGCGRREITRASNVEPYPPGDPDSGKWYVSFLPIGIAVELGPFETRSEALAAEHEWLDINYIRPGKAAAP